MLKPVSHAFWLTGIPYGKRFKRKKVIFLTIGLPQNILQYTGHLTDLTGRSPPQKHLLAEQFYLHKKTKSMRYIILTACLAMFIGASCKKNKPTKTELEKLPPITEIGANTFGCLLNGVAYKPGAGGVFDNVLTIIYDPSFQGGDLSIRAKRVNNGNTMRITLNGDSINSTGVYPLLLHSKFNIVFSDQLNCRFHTFYDTPSDGILNISKFDTSSRIISGTFSFKISTSDCGLVEATDGRFDVKY